MPSSSSTSPASPNPTNPPSKPWSPSPAQLGLIKLVVFSLGLLPLARLLGDLGPNPPEFVSQHTGTWTFNLLLLTLCVSPLRAWTGAHWLIRLRRSLGLLSFFYALLHLASFALFEHEFAINAIARDILDRPFIAVGFVAFLLMLPLALTSNHRAIARLGGRRWQELHRNIYLIGILAAVHYLWLARITEYFYPLSYTIILALLLAWRVGERLKKSHQPVPAGFQGKVEPLHFFKQKPGTTKTDTPKSDTSQS